MSASDGRVDGEGRAPVVEELDIPDHGSRACYSRRLDDALALATDAFRYQRRKSTDIPYLSHLLAVMVAVAEHGGDEDQMIAAVLHDYLEDIKGSTEAQLAERFGPRVAKMVADLSDTTVLPKPPWAARKLAYLDHLGTLAPDVRLISAADKLHNATSIRRGVERDGLAVFDRFSASMARTLWYYRSVSRILSDGWSHPLADRLQEEVVHIHALVGVPLPPPPDPLPPD